MEQKRTLWIIAAVGVFLLVVLGAALVLYAPTSKPNQIITQKSNNTSSNGWISLDPANQYQDSNDYYNQQDLNETETIVAQENQNLGNNENPTNVKDLTVYAENATIMNQNATIEGNANAESQKPTVINNTTTIDLSSLPEPKVVVSLQNQKSETSQKIQQTSLNNQEKLSQQKVENSSVTKKNSNKVAKIQEKSDSKKSNVAKQKTETKKIEQTQYWIQVTSLTSRKSADIARQTLDDNKISADVFTYTDSKGKLFYRVRVGPYTTKSEAEYWQTKISKIDNFKNTNSYVASTKVEI